jgi:hypothetical protein
MKQTIELSVFTVKKRGNVAEVFVISEDWRLPIPRIGDGFTMSDGYSFLIGEVNWILNEDNENKKDIVQVVLIEKGN